MVSNIVKDFPPNNLVFAWDDDWRPKWRVDLVPTYKAHRVDEESVSGESFEEIPDLLGPQIGAIADILDAIGLVRIGQVGHEADDILGALAAKTPGSSDIVTGDRDLFQLVDDASDIRVISITKGVKNLEIVTDEYLQNRYGVTGAQYADFSMLRGDPSDGLPGVKGIGEKTAAKLIATFGNVDTLSLAAKDPQSELPKAVRANLLESSDYMKRAGQVVRVKTNAKLPKSLAVPNKVKDPELLNFLVSDWGIERQVTRLLKRLNIVNLDS
jgi:5'-3' exonuclease